MRHQKLLAALLINVDRVVPVPWLIDLLWSEDPPSSAHEQITNGVAMIRRRLCNEGGAPTSLIMRPAGGVRLCRIADVEIDLDTLEDLASAAERASGPAQVASLLRQAVGLWRGPTLAGLDGEALRATAAYFDERRLSMLEQCIAAELDFKAPETQVAELTALVAAHPYRERFTAQLMRALNNSGRRADALAAFRSLALRLRDELAIEASAELTALHRSILRESTGTGTSRARGPRQLPPDVSIFEGRSEVLTMLDRLTSAGGGAPSPVVAIAGMGGVGKTALAVRWAYTAASRFPDGQLYLNMHGYDRHAQVTATQALARLLAALNVPADRIPADEETAGALYRSLIVDRRMIVILDNVYAVDQIRPLLAAGAANVTVVTSRNTLVGLVVRDGASMVALDPLSADESHALLVRLLAGHRRNDDAHMYANLAKSCGRLPLALRVAAANLAAQPLQSVDELVAALHDGIDAFDVPGDPDTTLSVLFSHSYRGLPPAQAAMFRLLAAAPCTDYTAVMAGAAAGLTTAEAALALDALVRASMVAESREGRYGYHDLLRDYAAAQAGPAEVAAATGRLVSAYLQLAAHTQTTLDGSPSPNVAVPPQTVDRANLPDDRATLLAFLDAETLNLLAITRAAAETGRADAGWQIPYLLGSYLDSGRNVTAAVDLCEAAVDAAITAGDDIAERRVSVLLGVNLNHVRRGAEALGPLTRALELARAQGMLDSEAAALNNIGVAHKTMRDWGKALDAFEAAIRLRDHTANAKNCSTLNNIGNVYADLGDFERAHSYLSRAAALAEHLSDSSRGLTHNNLGSLAVRRGRYDEAARHLAASLRCALNIGDIRIELSTRIDMARAHLGAGEPEAAVPMLAIALELSRRVSSPHQEASILATLAEAHLAGDSAAQARHYLAQATTIRALAPDAAEQDRLERLNAQLDHQETYG